MLCVADFSLYSVRCAIRRVLERNPYASRTFRHLSDLANLLALQQFHVRWDVLEHVVVRARSNLTLSLDRRCTQ